MRWNCRGGRSARPFCVLGVDARMARQVAPLLLSGERAVEKAGIKQQLSYLVLYATFKITSILSVGLDANAIVSIASGADSGGECDG